MMTSSLANSFVFQRWQIWMLQAVALIALVSCEAPSGNDKLSGTVGPNIQGVYQGSYTYGSAYQKLAGQTVTFEISLHQARGSGKVVGVIKETYTGVGTAKHGFLWADVSGTCVGEEGVTHLQFRKTYRHFKQAPVTYHGSLPPGSSLLSGTWYFPDKPSDSGMFQIDGIHVQ